MAIACRSNCGSFKANTRRWSREIRGRGLMLGVELDLGHIAEHQNNLLSLLQEQGLLLYMVVSYLLNVERIRIAPSFTHGTVLRIEPPLIADAAIVRPSDRGAETAIGGAATRRFGRAARAPHGQVRLSHATSIARAGAAPALAVCDRNAALHALRVRGACSERRRLPAFRSDPQAIWRYGIGSVEVTHHRVHEAVLRSMSSPFSRPTAGRPSAS